MDRWAFYLCSTSKLVNYLNKEPDHKVYMTDLGDIGIGSSILNAVDPGFIWNGHTLSGLSCLGIDLDFNYMGLWDTVTSLGLNQFDDNAELSKENMSLRIPAEFKSAAHAVAVNEHRNNFHSRSIYSSTASANQINGKVLPNGKVRIEKGFMGAHADIGGGYAEGDLSDVSLMWIIAQAKKAGVKINDDYLKTNQYDSIENPIVHDSVGVSPGQTLGIKPKTYYPEREVIWVDDTPGPSMFTSPDHLELVWGETLKFQNEDILRNPDLINKFQKARDLVQEIIEERKELFCNDVVPGLPGCDIKKLLDEYYAMKTVGLGKDMKPSKDQVIMYDSEDEDERIQINEYLKWINTHYNTSITTQLEY